MEKRNSSNDISSFNGDEEEQITLATPLSRIEETESTNSDQVSKKKLEKNPSVETEITFVSKSVTYNEDYLEKLKDTFITKKNLEEEMMKTIVLALEKPHTPDRLSVIQTILLGINNKRRKTGEGVLVLEQDFFTMMMLNLSWTKISLARNRSIWLPSLSSTWLVGLVAIATQTLFAYILLVDQIMDHSSSSFQETFNPIKTEYNLQLAQVFVDLITNHTLSSLEGYTSLNIPIKTELNLRIAQLMVIFLSVMTQTDFLMGFRMLLLFPPSEQKRWKKIIPRRGLWSVHVLFPNCLRIIQGGLMLFVTFVIIVQSESLLDLLKDYSALFVISSIHDVMFNMANNGFLGDNLSTKTEEARAVRIEKKNERLKSFKPPLFGSIITVVSICWIYIIIGQDNGRYVKQAYPFCPADELDKYNFPYHSFIGDKKCQDRKGEGTNTLNCGWDGGDCLVFNEKFPNCEVENPMYVGNGVCNGGDYNTAACGFDNGDCIEDNYNLMTRFPGCLVQNPLYIGDGFCDEGEYYTEQCSYDGGDCNVQNRFPYCEVENLHLVGNGICDGYEYNIQDCGYDDGDCVFNNTYPGCLVDNVTLIGNGFCNGNNYNTYQCGFDGGDCLDSPYRGCTADELSRIGNGFCDGEEYNTEECDFDGGDCSFNNTYPGCIVDNQTWIGNGYCNDNEYNTFQCGYDGGDCFNITYPDCKVDQLTRIGDGFCDEGSYQSESCNFDGGDCTPSMELVGESFWPGPSKWMDGVLGNDGKLYGIPFDANKILRFDPTTNTSALVGQNLGYTISKWQSGVLGQDGFIYAIPWEANSILKYDPSLETTSFLFEDHELIKFTKFRDSLVAKNGDIYLFPVSNSSMLKFNPDELENSLTAIEFNEINWEKEFGVLGGDGDIYVIPSHRNDDPIKRISLSDNNVSFIEKDPGGWSKGILAKDGNIYACPTAESSFQKILQIDVAKQETSLIGPDVGLGFTWSDFIEGTDGFLYGFPTNSNILMFDPVDRTFVMTPSKFSLHEYAALLLAENDLMYAIPSNAERVLVISHPEHRK